MKVISFTAVNFKGLKSLTHAPEGNLVLVGGQNAQGKSSALDAITAALCGKSAMPSNPIRNGEEESEISVTTEEFTIIRKFRRKGEGYSSTVKITPKDAAKASYSRPEEFLAGLVGPLGFDPMEFARLSTKGVKGRREQADQLRGLMGLDFAALDAERAHLYATRRDVNAEVKRLQAVMDSIPVTYTHSAPVNSAELMAELGTVEATIRQIEARNQRIKLVQEKIAATDRELDGLRQKIADAEAQKATDEAQLLSEKGQAENAMRHVSKAEELRSKIASADETNAQIRQATARKDAANEFQVASGKSTDLTGKITEIDQRKLSAIKGAPLPIPGLGFSFSESASGDVELDGVTLGGVPLEDCSSAQRLIASVGVAVAGPAAVRVVMIREGAFLDDRALVELAKFADANDVQIFVERVGTSDNCQLIITDGAQQ